MPRSLIDPRLRQAIPSHWPSLCTIRQIVFTPDASNQPLPTGATPVSGMVNVPCRLGPLIQDRPQNNEVRNVDVTETFDRRHLKLNAHLPSIIPYEMDALVDGVVYSIRGVEQDGNSFSTRLRVEVVKP